MFRKVKKAEKLASAIEEEDITTKDNELVAVYAKVVEGFIPSEQPNLQKILSQAAKKAEQTSAAENQTYLYKVAFFATTVASLFILLLAVLLFYQTVTKVEKPAKGAYLPVVGSFAKLQKLLAAQRRHLEYKGFKVEDFPHALEIMPKAVMPAIADKQLDSSFSRTNVQVEGVDEADVIKTDGQFIYQIEGKTIRLIKAVPPKTMQLVSAIQVSNFTLEGLYIDKDYLIVLGTSRNPGQKIKNFKGSFSRPSPGVPETSLEIGRPSFYLPDQPVTKLLVYNITNKSAPFKQREVELEGQLLTSRKIGPYLYFVANKYIDAYLLPDLQPLPQEKKVKPELRSFILPTYKDSVVGSKRESLPLSKVHYFPANISSNYLLIGALNLEDLQAKMGVSAYLGGGSDVYASASNLYVTSTQRQFKEVVNKKSEVISQQLLNEATKIYKFKLDKTQVSYQAQQEVPGRVLNQFSLDEYNSYFRLATTSDGEEGIQKNNIYVLDNDLKVVGKIEGLAPGEQIYSARFMGSRVYLVTYKTMDPFFVIDLNQPTAPKVLGELKIPGYSSYLHPYDENHIIGFGVETQVANSGVETQAANSQPGGMPPAEAGLKVAVFDVSDVSQPKEKFKTTIGEQGTYSELLDNHKALLFSREKKLLAFPVKVRKSSIASSPESDVPHTFLEEPQMVFQGAYVYSLDLTNGLNLKGKVTHLNPKNRIYSLTEESLFIKRLLYIDNSLYSLSAAMIKANSLTDLKEEASLVIK